MEPFRARSRLLPLLLALLVCACTSAPPTPSPAASPSTTEQPAPSTPLPVTPPPATPPPVTPAIPPASPTPLPPSPSPTPILTPALPLGELSAGPLQTALDDRRARLAVPGVAAAVIFPDGSRWGGGAGYRSLDPERPATPDTPFVTGSISKTYVAAAVMALVADGVLSLDDPLADWLPDYPRARRITLRMLLDHSSGVANYFELKLYNRLVFKATEPRIWTAQEILDTFDAPFHFQPGEGYRYSNTGFVLLGLVIEAASGQSLGEFYRQRFFEPLGLRDTYYQGEGPPPPDAAHGFRTRPDGVLYLFTDGTDYRPTASAATVANAAGAITASANDVATWTHALYGGELLPPELLAEMTDWKPAGGVRGDYGLGTRTRLFEGYRGFGHTGSVSGFIGATWYFPELELTISVLNNRGVIDPDRETRALLRAVLPAVRDYLGIASP